MELESFGKSATAEGIPNNKSIIVVGDRDDVHRRAIGMGVRLIIVTGGHRMKPDTLTLAKDAQVSVAYADTDSATTAWAVRASTLVGGLVQRDAFTFKPQEKLSVARRRIVQNPALICNVVDEDGHLLGVFTKTDIINPPRAKLVLVDHNELSQAVDGPLEPVRDLFLQREAFDAWATRWQQRLHGQPGFEPASTRQQMLRTNPRLVLRNHLAEIAIRQARTGDFAEVQRLLKALQAPFDERPGEDDLAALPPDWAAGIEISCSS